MATPQNCPNKILLSSSNELSYFDIDRSEEQYLVFFLPGNPGLIEFYKEFLQALHKKLSKRLTSSEKRLRVDVLGLTLPGFECGFGNGDDYRRKKLRLPLDIEGQLKFIESTLDDHIVPKTKVILMGHSLGAYLVMEMLRRRGKHLDRSSSSVVGTIGLFPTVVHLARSNGAQRVQRLLGIPCLAFFVTLFVRVLCFFPTILIQYALQILLRYPAHSANTTAHWLQSRWGFVESLHLLREEFQVITADTWNGNVWNSGVHLLFGEQDEWVSSVERDALILARARKDTKHANSKMQDGHSFVDPCLELAAVGIPHDFGIRHSGPVAEHVANWIERLIGASKDW